MRRRILWELRRRVRPQEADEKRRGNASGLRRGGESIGIMEGKGSSEMY